MHYKQIESLNDWQVDQLVSLYEKEFWCHTREKSDVLKMLDNTDIIIGIETVKEKQLVGFCRLLSDYVYKATVYDLIVAEGHRGQNLARDLMNAIFGHPNLIDVQTFDLHCLPEMFPFYEKWGFTSNLGKVRCMRKER